MDLCASLLVRFFLFFFFLFPARDKLLTPIISRPGDHYFRGPFFYLLAISFRGTLIPGACVRGFFRRFLGRDEGTSLTGISRGGYYHVVEYR